MQLHYLKTRRKLIYFFVLFISLTFLSETRANQSYSKGSPTIYYSYKKNGTEEFKIYVRIKEDTYVLFRLVHEVGKKENKNLWRIKDSYLCQYKNNEMSEKYQVLTTGENEFVWFSARPGVKEATGGYHGNERIDTDSSTFVKFFANHKEIDLSVGIPLSPCSSFHYIQYSSMHQTGTGGLINSDSYIPVAGHPIECYHQKETIFGNGGYTTNNKLIWANNNASVKRVYYGIFSINRNASKKGFIDTGTKKPEIITFNEDGKFKLKSSNQRIVMYNNEYKISVTCDSKVLKGGPFDLNASIRDHDYYHKYYSAINNKAPIKPSENEIWETTASISFEIYSKKKK